MDAPNSNYSESVQNAKIKSFEKLNEEKSKDLFKQLCELNNGQNTIDLNFIRQILALNDNKFSPAFLKIITRYQLTDAIKEGNFNAESYYKRVLSSDEFVHFITGKDIKELIFENDKLIDKRFKTATFGELQVFVPGNYMEYLNHHYPNLRKHLPQEEIDKYSHRPLRLSFGGQ